MSRLLLLAWLLLAALPVGATETVRIAVAEGLASVDVTGLRLGRGPWGDEEVFTPLKRDKVHVTTKAGQLLLDGKPAGSGLRLSGEGLLGVRGFKVRGTVDLKATPHGILVINAIPLEDYLAAVLGGEMPPNFPAEALKAQAVAARTYALQRKIDAYGKPYHLGATVLSQVYGGAGREDPRTKAAVEQTAGLVLTFELAPIEAYFHASCGGRTESGKVALGRDLPYLQPVDCPCGKDPKLRWSYDVADKALPRDLHLTPADLEISQRSATGRAAMLSDGDHHLDAITLRRLLGYDKVKSLTFTVEHAHGGLHFSGKGMGHGAGFCQYGAKAYAEQGRDYVWILNHYYPGAEIQRMY